MLTVGLKGRAEETVTTDKTAIAVGSGALPVYSTPSMAALMEKTAMDSVAKFLDKGETTVGTKLGIEHVSASPVGAVIDCESVLKEVDGRRLVFEVTAMDDAGVIGRGTHERFIVNSFRFMEKINNKLS